MVWIGKYTTRYGEYFYFVFRIIIGGLFIMHGAQKLFGSFEGPGMENFANFVGLSTTVAYIPATVEFVGGIFIVIGLLTRWSALFGAIEMIFAWFIVHVKDGEWNPLLNGGELVVLYFAAFLVILVYGARKWGFDKLFFKSIY